MSSLATGETKTATTHASGKILDQEPTLDLKDELENELSSFSKRSNGKKRWTLDAYQGGQKGQTAVYSAKDARGGKVALKFVHSHNEDVKRRFKREVAMQSMVVGVRAGVALYVWTVPATKFSAQEDRESHKKAQHLELEAPTELNKSL